MWAIVRTIAPVQLVFGTFAEIAIAGGYAKNCDGKYM